MKKIQNKAHTKEELIAIFKEQHIPEKWVVKFLEYYKVCYVELSEDEEDFEDEDLKEDETIQSRSIYWTLQYAKVFLELLNKGHSEEWAHEMAYSQENEGMKAYYVFHEIAKKDSELAKKEIVKHCHSLSDDEDYRRHYLKLFDAGYGTEDPREKAENFSRIFKKELSKGKSELYAQMYAEKMASGYFHKIFCEDYAFSFDKAIENGKSEDYAYTYAEKYASLLVKVKRRHGISGVEDVIEYNEYKALAYMNAWEYVSLNKIEDGERFIQIYEQIYLNSYFSDEINDCTLEEMDKQILEEALIQHSRS